jgi:hypothetical protein
MTSLTPADSPGRQRGHGERVPQRQSAASRWKRCGERVAGGARRHWLFLILFVAGASLRALSMVAYRPALYYPDSGDYLWQSVHLKPTGWHPPGYGLFLWLFRSLHNVTYTPLANHLMILGASIGIYSLLSRLGVARWLAALGCAPLLLDAFQINIEQYVLSEALFESMLTAAFVLLLWKRKPSLLRSTTIGLLLSYACLVRTSGAILVVPVVVFLVITRAGWKKVVLCVVAFSVPILGSAAWFDATYGTFTTSDLTGYQLYTRTGPIANCSRLTLPKPEHVLCPKVPVNKRPGAPWFVSDPSPAVKLRTRSPKTFNATETGFDLAVLEHQPVDYSYHVTLDWLRQFLPGHPEPKGIREEEIYFQPHYPGAKISGVPDVPYFIDLGGGGPLPSSNVGVARFLVQYQRVGYTSGPLELVFLLVALAASFGIGASRRSPRRPECALLVAAGPLVVFFTFALVFFNWRYVLPNLIFLPPAGVLGASMLWPALSATPRPHRHSRSRGTTIPPVAAEAEMSPV